MAAGLVLAHHLSIYTPGLSVLGALSSAGYVGVTFFFVLSGFVLTYSWDVRLPIRQFYRRRAARVYPVHLLFVAVAATPLIGPTAWSAIPLNGLLLQSWSTNDDVALGFNSVAWSLSCEVFFYAMLPVMIRPLSAVRRPLALVARLIGSGFVVGILLETHNIANGALLYHLPPFRLIEFVAGALAARAVSRGWVPRLGIGPALMLVTTSYLVVLVLPAFIGYRVQDRWALSLAMAPGFLVLISAFASRDISGGRSPIRRPVLVALGQWSFCLYMAHPFILRLTRPLLESTNAVAAILGGLIVVLAVVGVSYLLYSTFERPLERRLRGVAVRRASDESVPERIAPAPERIAPVLGLTVPVTEDAAWHGTPGP